MKTVPIAVSRVVRVDRSTLWEELRRIDRHVLWMADAETITFAGTQREGEGTSFLCVTKVGPLRLRDRMTISAWEPERAMGVVHEGLVTGSGVMTLGERDGATELSWREELAFPWWMAGSLGGRVARPILKAIWNGNLRRLAALVERTA